MKKFVCAIMIILIWCGGLIGCFNNEKPNTTANDKEIIIANFEQWAPDFQLINVIDGFGAVNQNENADFVRSGSKSAKLQPIGYTSVNDLPCMYIPLQSKVFDFNYSNITKVKAIKASVYNSQSMDKEISIGFVMKIVSAASIMRQLDDFIVIKPGWNDLLIPVDASVLRYNMDILNVAGISFTFKKAESICLDKAPIYYLDDVKFEIDSNYVISDAPRKEAREGEVESFDDVISMKSVLASNANLKDWLPSFKGETGVVKVFHNKISQWKIEATDIIPRLTKAAYENKGYTKVVIRMFIPSSSPIDSISILGGSVYQSLTKLKDRWIDLEFDVSFFLDNFDKFADNKIDNGFLFLLSHTVNPEYYISDFFLEKDRDIVFEGDIVDAVAGALVTLKTPKVMYEGNDITSSVKLSGELYYNGLKLSDITANTFTPAESGVYTARYEVGINGRKFNKEYDIEIVKNIIKI